MDIPLRELDGTEDTPDDEPDTGESKGPVERLPSRSRPEGLVSTLAGDVSVKLYYGSQGGSHSKGKDCPHGSEDDERCSLDGDPSEEKLVARIRDLDVLDDDHAAAGGLQEEGEHWDVSLLRAKAKVMRLTIRKDESPRDPVGLQGSNKSVRIKMADLRQLALISSK